jgi:crotonobetainyl-CoA:carnitine CoA-transferase CaiB-like acyl-CoA transferase
VNIQKPEGVEIIKRLVKKVDVFVENFRPGVMDRRGLGYKDIRSTNPRIIYASLTAFGDHGPYKNKPGFELIIQSVTGVVSVTSENDRPPSKVQVQMVDLCGGLFLAVAIMGALYHRKETGEGQHVKTSLMEGSVAMMTNLIGMHLMGAKVPTVMRTRNPQLFPSQAFKTRDGYISVVCPPDHWGRFCKAIEREDWIDDPKIGDVVYRVTHYEEMETLVEEVMKTKSTEKWLQLFEKNQVAVGRINTVEEMFSDPQFQALNMIQTLQHTTAGKIDILRPPYNFSLTPSSVRLPPPALAEHTFEVLSDAGFKKDDITQFERDGVIELLESKRI